MYIIGYIFIIGVIVLIIVLIKSFINRAKIADNRHTLVNDIYMQALSSNDRWYAISSKIGNGKHASISIHRYSGKIDRFGFKEHGYDDLTRDGMLSLFHALKRTTEGELDYSYDEIGGYSGGAVTSFSTGFTPGGGTGLYANTTSDRPAKDLIGISLYSREYAAMRKEKARQKAENEKKYKKTF